MTASEQAAQDLPGAPAGFLGSVFCVLWGRGALSAPRPSPLLCSVFWVLGPLERDVTPRRLSRFCVLGSGFCVLCSVFWAPWKGRKPLEGGCEHWPPSPTAAPSWPTTEVLTHIPVHTPAGHGRRRWSVRYEDPYRHEEALMSIGAGAPSGA